MTTSGFLSPAREGKLPESRIPVPPSDSRSNSPLPPSYPMVPPEVKGEKKSKKGTLKKSLDGLKRLDKENKKKEAKSKESKKNRKHMLIDDSKVKKLISMKEFSKLKAFKAGALKLMARSTSGGSGSKSKLSSSKMSLSKSHGKALKFNKVASQSKMSKVDKFQSIPLFPQPKAPGVEKVKTPKTVEGKLSSEPDKQKLNIFKKISKVKEEKLEKEKQDRLDSVDFYPKDSRESSPGLVIDELEVQNQQREARLVQINDCINAVIMRGMKEMSHDSKVVRESKSQVLPIPSSVSKNDSAVSNVVVAHGPESSKDIYMFDDNDLSPPGTPSTPKTPELPTPARKLEKIMEKKKKKDKSKSKKDSKAKLAKELLNAKKIKVELNDYENSGRPKTPEVPEPQESAHTPVFPFFPSFPPAPGLIPPPLGHHPLFPRFPYSGLPKPAGSSGATGQQPAPSSNLPHPAMPNLPLPPALFMQPRPDGPPEVKDEPPERPSVPAPQPIVSPPAPVVVKTEKTVEKSQPVHPLTPKEKVVEKKSKEHKKEKKDKDKVKKKKDKKDKGKGKEKSEKKRDKEEKKDREKGKEKKEKKEKKKDKEREDKSEKSETSVPKLTLKLPPSASSPRPSTPDTQSRKLVIKTVVKKNAPEERPPSAGSNESLSKRAPSPELAKFSALITRPPKQKGSSKVPHLESESSSSLHHQPIAEESLPPAPHHHVAPTPPPAPVSLPPPPPEQPPPPPQVPHHPPPSVPPPPSVIPPPPLATPPAPSTSSLPLGGLSASTKAKKGLTKPFSKVKQPKDSSKRPLPPEADAPKAFYFDTHGNKIWICPACGGQDDGSPMIGCDDCDAWYHWVCVGMQVPPDDNEDWYCRVCIVKKEESLVDKKKKARKKK
ncbi:transcription initiation factor TFIID subunit 3-like isoform X3 [Ischnura elegans]|nr:transcription initiation factor TFIID subunit 3-like isoform X3 [Ischnura elegans]